MAFDSVAAFVDDVCRSRVLQPEQQAELKGKLRTQFLDPRDLAWFLFEKGWLTTYQINELTRGHAVDLSLGDYVILDRLGQGGIGEVFKARRASDEVLAALKVIRPELLSNAEAVRQFRWEIEILAQMSHPNLVKTFDSGQAGERCFFAMEFVEGAPLRKLVKSAGPLPMRHACSYMRQAALGLQYAHELRLIHRDVKPANLFLCLPLGQADRLAAEGWESVPFAEEALVKVLDWGLASLVRPMRAPGEPGRTPTSVPIGTADYVSPEQAMGEIDIRSDVYSLGCTFYYMLAATPPFPGGSIMQKLLRHQQDEPIPLTAHRPDMPAELQAVVGKMMAKRPADRYQTPVEVVEAIGKVGEAVRQSRPVISLPPVTPAPPRKDATDAERRTAIRHSCGVTSSCRPITSGVEISWPVQVTDVSRNGIGMCVERRFELNALLEIDLQSVVPHLDRTLLATVRNVRHHDDGDWVVGCSFARPLDDEELWAFRAAQIRAPREECRAWYRRPPAELDTQPVQILNISPAGIALVVPRPMEAGVSLQLELQPMPEAPPLMKQVHVIHVTARAEGDWLVGCAFLGELGEEEMFNLTG
jgi:serine/threonine protein kinase